MVLMERSFDPPVFTKKWPRLLGAKWGSNCLTRWSWAKDRRSLLSDEYCTVDGTLIEVAAGLKSFKPRDADPPPDDCDRGNPSVRLAKLDRSAVRSVLFVPA